MITDSGGVQEETSVLGVPCITYRTTTERPITVELGHQPTRRRRSRRARRGLRARSSSAGPPKSRREIPLWDGHAGERAAAAVAEWLGR